MKEFFCCGYATTVLRIVFWGMELSLKQDETVRKDETVSQNETVLQDKTVRQYEPLGQEESVREFFFRKYVL